MDVLSFNLEVIKMKKVSAIIDKESAIKVLNLLSQIGGQKISDRVILYNDCCFLFEDNLLMVFVETSTLKNIESNIE